MATPVLANATINGSPSVLANGTDAGSNATDSGSNTASNASNAAPSGSNAASGSPSGFVGYPQSGGLLHPDLRNLLLAIQEAHLYKDSKTAV
jgi:hypothetical protein